MGSKNRLVLIPNEDLPILRDMYKINWPRHILNYHTINNFVLWLDKYPSIEGLSIWSLNGTWRQNGTVIIKSYWDVHCATLEETQESLVQALCLLDWKEPLLICSFPDYIRPAVLKTIEKVKAHVNYDTEYTFFILAKDKAKDLEPVKLSDGLSIRQLSEAEVSTANDNWPYKKDGSLVFLQRMMKYNVSYGAYSVTGQLVGWVFIDSSGGIGILHVVDEYRRKRIAEALVIEISKHIAGNLGLNPHTFILPDNIPSIGLFKKLGFEANTEPAYWIQMNPRAINQKN
ncbi:uncharacterized protein LOC129807087 [Phlebotomus papatasi]|uniref:uncharacterized protein LOC129807087 n=1 Tax=Phlebotomus papatasi TaxID=29031 RepID=UPI002483A67A|nr:uncharacterized protein LOC129807087 [Phlebotomus papatasi]